MPYGGGGLGCRGNAMPEEAVPWVRTVSSQNMHSHNQSLVFPFIVSEAEYPCGCYAPTFPIILAFQFTLMFSTERFY